MVYFGKKDKGGRNRYGDSYGDSKYDSRYNNNNNNFNNPSHQNDPKQAVSKQYIKWIPLNSSNIYTK